MPISKDTQQGINTPSHQYYFKKLTVYDFQNDIFIKKVVERFPPFLKINQETTAIS